MSDSVRPYDHQFAWAYDLLQSDPVERRVDFIQSTLREHGIDSNSTILDAGCGTGRYATELASRGFRVWGVDRSVELLAVARDRDPAVQWIGADLLEAAFPVVFDAVLCRAVLNDLASDGERGAVFRKFAEWTPGPRPGRRGSP